MKTSKRNKLIGLALIGSYSLFNATGVLAAAGDTISNRATLNYDVGGSAQVLIESGTGVGNSTPGATNGSDTDFLEDRLINFTVTRGGATSQVIPNATLQAVEYTVENTGNGSQGFLLRAFNNADGTADPFGGNADVFDTTVVQTFVEDGTTVGFQPAEDTVAFIASLAVSPVTQIVYVVTTIPATRSDLVTALVSDDVAVMSLVAQVAIDGSTGIAGDAIVADDNGNTSPGGTGFTNGAADVVAGVAVTNADDPTTVEVVFNDGAGTLDGTGAAGATQNAQHADDSSYTVQSAELTVTKDSLALWDPINLATSPKSIPGGYVRYIVSVENAAGAADADLTTLSDVLPAELVLDPDFTDGTAANNPTNAVGDAIAVVKGATTVFCTGDIADADGDGCSYTGGAGGTVAVDLANVGFAAIVPLAATETVSISFNTIVQ